MIKKTTRVVIFNLKNYYLLTLSLPTKKAFGKRPKSASSKSSGCRFSFSAGNANTKPTEYVTLGFSFSILVSFLFQEGLNLTVCKRYGFFSVLTAIIRESSDKQLVLRIVKALPFIHQPNRVVPKASDVSAADWLYQHTFLICELLYFPRLWPSLV